MQNHDEKYVVFRREDWDHFQSSTQGADIPERLDDAVVIRTRDIFAGPVLHTYAGAVQTAIEVIEGTGNDATDWLEHLKVVRDYFNERASEADAAHPKRFPTAP